MPKIFCNFACKISATKEPDLRKMQTVNRLLHPSFLLRKEWVEECRSKNVPSSADRGGMRTRSAS